jgi:hypothetical protein
LTSTVRSPSLPCCWWFACRRCGPRCRTAGRWAGGVRGGRSGARTASVGWDHGARDGAVIGRVVRAGGEHRLERDVELEPAVKGAPVAGGGGERAVGAVGVPWMIEQSIAASRISRRFDVVCITAVSPRRMPAASAWGVPSFAAGGFRKGSPRCCPALRCCRRAGWRARWRVGRGG